MQFQNFRFNWIWVVVGISTLNSAGWTQADPQTERQAAEIKPAKALVVPFTISVATTRITKPLKPDGTVDYATALNSRLSQGVTPENNAAIPLMQVFGSEIILEANREAFYHSLRVPLPKTGKGLFQSFSSYLEQHLSYLGDRPDFAVKRQFHLDEQEKAQEQPWSRKEFPLVANWVDANAEAANLAREASKKSRLYIPVVIEEKEPLFTFLLPVAQNLREMARLLTARAMLAVKEGRIEEAQQDLLACHRLAVLMGQQGQQSSIIEGLVCYALDSMACRGDLALAQSGKATRHQLITYRQQLAQLPPLTNMGETVDSGERLFSLDAICHLAMNVDDETQETFGLPSSKLWDELLNLVVDWDFILKRFNHQFDHIAATFRIPNYQLRAAVLSHTESKLQRLLEEVDQPPQFNLIFLGLDSPRGVVSRHLGNKFLTLLIPAVSQAAEYETRAKTRREMTIVVLALAQYQLERSHYPETLSDLSPKYLKSLPTDRFIDKPFKYQKQETGYLLYSMGPNGKDDRGPEDSPDGETDDIAIRVPLSPES